MAALTARVNKKMCGKARHGSKAHHYQHVRPPVTGEVVNVDEETVGIVAMLSRARGIDGGGRENFPGDFVIGSPIVKGTWDYFILAIAVRVSRRDSFRIEQVGQLPDLGIPGIGRKARHTLGEVDDGNFF